MDGPYEGKCHILHSHLLLCATVSLYLSLSMVNTNTVWYLLLLDLYLVSEPRISASSKGISTHHIVPIESIVYVWEGPLHHWA